MQLHQLKRPRGIKRPYRRVGRGQSSTRGKTSGRGGKGQTARAGAKIRPEWRDIIKKLPKMRGWGKNRRRGVVTLRPRSLVVPLSRIAGAFNAGDEVTSHALIAVGVIRRHARLSRIKIVGNVPLQKKLLFKNMIVSSQAKAAIEKAGGSIT